jgi:hypothetical protein
MVECMVTTNWCQLNVFNPLSVGQSQFTVDTNWHIFTTVWNASTVTESVDGVVQATSDGPSPTGPMFLIMQIQTGGLGGNPNNAFLPATLGVDYVRVTQP